MKQKTVKLKTQSIRKKVSVFKGFKIDVKILIFRQKFYRTISF